MVTNRYDERDSKGRRKMTLREALGLPREDELQVARRKLAEARARGRQMRQELGLLD